MAIKQQREVYDDWSGGHWGINGPFKAAPGQYRAVNLQMYRNNTIGPRPGWKLLETTGTAPAPSAGSGSEMYGMAWIPGSTSDGGYLVFVSKTDSTATRRLDIDTLAWASTTLGAPTNDMQLAVPNGGVLAIHQANNVIVGAQKSYDPSTDTTNTVTFPDSFSPRASVAYKARNYAWGDSTFPGRVYFSDSGSYTAFVSGQYFNVGTASRAVMGMWVIGDSLLILAMAGSINGLQTDAEWWTLQGANPLTGSLRLIAKDTWPGAPAHAAVFKDILMFQDSFYDQGILAHDGSALNTSGLRHLTQAYANKQGGAISRGGVATVGEPSVVLPYVIGATQADESGDPIGDFYDNGVQAWELVNGVWTKAVYWNGATDSENGAELFLRGVTGWEGSKLIACTNDSSDGSGEYKFFTREISYDRYNASSATYSDPSEYHPDLPSSSEDEAIPNILWLPAIQSEIGGGVRIRRVIVDVDYWKNLYTIPVSTADLKVSVGNYRLENGTYAETDVQQSSPELLESTQALGNNPSQARLVFRFDTTPFYSASQVRLADIRNMAIDRVTVEYESQMENDR